MKRIGVMNSLEVLRFTSVGAYLNDIDETSETDVLLPTKYVPDQVEVGDMIEVFLYRDSEDRLIATTLKPAILLGEIGKLRVADTNQFGAFLSWGLEKDLFLPFKEQIRELKKGDWVVAMLYEDSSERLSATTKISGKLKEGAPYAVDSWVKGIIYQIHPTIGAFVAVENQYHGLIPKKECYGDLKEGDKVDVRIQLKKQDGKLDLALRERVSKQIFSDVDVLKAALEKAPGKALPFCDTTDPAIISRELQMSKRAFKRAAGMLLKQGVIAMDEKGMHIVTTN